jgi:hypothetical protein
MKTHRIAGGLAAAIAVAAGACAHDNGAAGKGGVRIAGSSQEVQGCDRIAEVRLQGTWTRSQAVAELQSLAQGKGANVLLLTDSGASSSGIAYRCSSGTSAGSIR